MRESIKTVMAASLLLLTAFAAISLVCIGDLDAESESFVEDGLCYTVNGDGKTVTLTGPENKSLTILDISNGVVYHQEGKDTVKYRITSIGPGAFKDCIELSVKFPKSLISIGTNAFSGCISITEVELPYDVIVNAKAFAGCTNIKTVKIPYSASITPDAFDGCSFYENVDGEWKQITDSDKLIGYEFHGDSYDMLKKVKECQREYYVNYDENGGSVHIEGYWTSYKNITLTYYFGDYTGEGRKIFSGWNDGKDKDKTWSPGDRYNLTSSVTFTAVWVDPPMHTISFDINGGTGKVPESFMKSEGTAFNLPACTATLAGYKFAGWNDGSKTYDVGAQYVVKTKDVTFKAKWNSIPFHAVTYDENGGSAEAPTQSKVQEGSMVRVAKYEGIKEGYSFGGWNDGKNIYAPEALYTVNESVRFTAVWNLIPTHVVKYDVDGGTDPINPKIVQEWTIFYLEDYKGTKEMHTFMGWTDGKHLYSPGSEYKMGENDLSFKAVWEPNGQPISLTLMLIVFLAIIIIGALYVILRVLPGRR